MSFTVKDLKLYLSHYKDETQVKIMLSDKYYDIIDVTKEIFENMPVEIVGDLTTVQDND